MPFRSLLSFVLAAVLLSSVWGCQPGTHSEPTAADSPSAAAGSALVDSVQAARARLGASDSSAAVDSASLHRWADRLATMGDALISRQPDSAQALLQEALHTNRVLGDSGAVARTLERLGRSCAAQKQYEEALRHYRQAGSLYRALGTEEDIASLLQATGNALQQQDRPQEALEHYREALARYRKHGPRDSLGRALHDVGTLLKKQGRYEEALSSYRQALSIFREHEDQRGVARTLSNIGDIRQIQGRYEEALANLQEALAIGRALENRRSVAQILNDIGVVHYRQGHYEKALGRFRTALSTYRDLGDRRRVAGALNRVGAVYYIQGRYEDALTRYRTALAVNRTRGDKDGVARNLNNIGIIHRHQGRYEDAQTNFQRALSIHRGLDDRRDEAINLSNLGEVLRLQGRLGEALARYRAALSINRELGTRESIASNLNNIGKVRERQGHYDEALRYYRRALALRRALESHRQATSLRMIGDALLDRGEGRAATDTLNQAVRLAETLRLNATSPEARRSLLSTQISTYRALATAHVRAGQPESALRAVEQARARLLADRLAGTAQSDTTFTIPAVPALRQMLGSEEAALLYANAGATRPLTVLIVTKDTVRARELPEAAVRAKVGRTYANRLHRLRREEGSLTAALGTKQRVSSRARPSLAEVVRLYRYYLTREGTGDAVQQDLARRLHDLLVAPVEASVPQKTAFTVVPTGALGYLPFETLRDSTGQYLVETKHVRYAQSLTVLRQLRERTFGARPKPLLAVGGAAYGTSSPDRERPLLATARGDSTIGSDEQASALYRSAERRLERGQSPRATYAQLGYDRWPALYGTKLEVQKLQRAVGAGTTLLTGPGASEERVRQMSTSGALSGYRRLHFATHGVAVPEAPQLSALVLSQEGASDSLAARDGYLTMPEIADLEMQADVAVLSACRTGLGRIVAGEGVVSLSHAFLRAGANATLVSQWRVLDWSTQQFMTAVYRRATASDVSFAEAATQVKRAFIAGEFGARNTDPLRWAPFVYYGRD